ncbi:OmpL47-type beta-barrel domain-containing protein, partial [Methanolobus psychrotolerans]|uniref:OmpL47-type beta-barrel domain-containing protein n=1 Tax=Methanolobus psychrotolerans TaxID=1874706 RepID=UPI00101AE8DD
MSGIRTLTIISILLLILVCMSPVVMADVPPGPNVFEGTVLINGLNAPVGTVIEAYIDHGDMISDGNATVSVAGEYSITVSSGSSSDVNENVIFKVLNINSTDVGTFKNGPIIQSLDLTVEDLTAPVTTDDAPSGWQNSSFTVNLTAIDAGSGVNSTFYKINEGSWISGTSVLIDTDGNNTVMYYSVDNVGNVESNNTVYAMLDTTAPVVLVDPVTTPTNVSSQTINGSVVDVNLASVTVNGVSASLDGNNYSATIDLTEGANTITVVAADSAGNSGSNSSTSIVLDTVVPVVLVDPVTTPTNVSSQTINGSVVDVNLASVTVNGVSASLDGNNYSATIDLTEGANTIIVVAVDSAGNSGSNSSTSIVLDTVVPVVLVDPVTTPTNVSSQTINGSVVDVNLASVTVNGVSASLDGNNYSATIDLTEGANT